VDPPDFTLDLGPDLSIKLGERVDIQPDASLPIARFEWRPEGGIVCEQDCLGLQGFPTQSNTYTLTAYTAENCVAVDSIFIEVDTDGELYAPNVFSPNNDGVNDVFTVYGEVPLVQQITRLTILNRWGSVVYEANNLAPNQTDQGWNGRKNGELLDPGVYIWVADVLFLGQLERRFTGDVLLVR
jgi:gliding motility-associated-like protein